MLSPQQTTVFAYNSEVQYEYGSTNEKRLSTQPECPDVLGKKPVAAMDPHREVKLSLGICQYFSHTRLILRTEQQLPAFWQQWPQK